MPAGPGTCSVVAGEGRGRLEQGHGMWRGMPGKVAPVHIAPPMFGPRRAGLAPLCKGPWWPSVAVFPCHAPGPAARPAPPTERPRAPAGPGTCTVVAGEGRGRLEQGHACGVACQGRWPQVKNTMLMLKHPRLGSLCHRTRRRTSNYPGKEGWEGWMGWVDGLQSTATDKGAWDYELMTRMTQRL